MLKMFIDNEEVVSNKEFTITEEMLATSSTILNNCYPKTWEDTKNYVNNFYFPKDYSKCKIESGDFLYGNMPIAELNISGNNLNFITNITDRFKQFKIDGKSTQETRSGKNLFNIENKKSITAYEKIINQSIPAGTYHLTASSIISNSKKFVTSLITFRSNGEQIAQTYIGGTQPLDRLINLNKKCDEIYLYANSFYNNSVNITTTFSDLMISTDGGEYEQYGVMPSPDYPSEIKNIDGIRNLFNKNGNFNFGNNKYQTTLEENGTIKSIANYGTRRSAGQKITVKKNTDYNLSGILISATGTANTNVIVEIMGYENNVSKQIGILRISKDAIKPYNFSLKFNSGTYEEIWISLNGWNSTITGTTETIFDNLILTEGIKTHSYVPYGNWLQIKQTGEEYGLYKEKITNIGLNKDLFDKNNVEDGKLVVRTTGELTSNTSYYATDYIEVEPNTKYTEYGFNVWYTACYDENKTYISNVDNSNTFTTPENAKYIRMSLLKTNINIARLQKGEKIVDTELCSIGEVKDELIIKDGKAKINKRFGKIVLNGSESWANATKDNRNIYRMTLNDIKLQNYSSNVLPVTISNYFVGDNFYNLYQKNVDNAMSSHNSNHYLEIRSTKFSTVNELKTWLSTHNTTVYYELAEPYEVDLGDYNIELFDGVNNISLESEIETNLSLDYYYKNYDLLFCGFVKNSGNISLNPRYPHYCALEILDYKAMLSEGDTLDFVLSNITIGEAIELIIDKIKDYGFIVGNINIFNKNEVIGAYSTLNKTPYDVFQYLADISGSKWFTRVIDEYTIAIDFYDPTLMPKKANIDYTENYFEENNIIDISFSFSSRDYRNKQIMLSDQVIGNIDYTENILANGYDTNYLLQSNIAVLKKVLVNGILKTIATEEEKNMGIGADFYYTIGSNTFETAEIYSSNTNIQIIYTPLVKGRETIINDDEIERIHQYGRKGVIARYENRNDALSSLELQRIGQSYIKYKGNSEVSLVIKTKDKSLYNIGDVVYFNAPIDDLKQEYMVKKKETKIITTNGYNNVFYIFELSSSFNSEKEINWFDNQRNKANGNIQSGEYIDRNIDIDNKALIIFDNLQIKEVEVENTNTLDCVLESPFIN